jgi:hypothetical protein
MLTDRMVNILLFAVLLMIVLTVLVYGVIFLSFSPEEPLVLGLTGAGGPVAQGRQTPTGPDELVPTYPPTWTPTPTETPGPTFTPTETRTPTSTSTFTPTPTPLPTRTPTPTDTPAPTSTFTPAPSPTPLPYTIFEYDRHQNCFDIGMYGVVEDADGFPQGGVVLQYGEQGVAGSNFTTTTDASGRFAVGMIVGNDDLADQPHDWFIRVLENGQPASDTFTWRSDSIETCESDLAAQVMEINFIRRY